MEQPSKPKAAAQHDFSTTHLLDNLTGRTVSGGIVQICNQGVQFILTLGYSIIMARLLTPHEFGLVAMVTTVIGFLQIFRDMGLSTATIQRTDITHAQVSNLFWLNVGVSGIISILLAAGAPLIAWFYHEPKLVNIALALSANFILNGLAGQHIALLNRQMRFGIASVIEMSSLAVSFTIGIVMAVKGFGYWSLVAATPVQSALRLIAIWSVSQWRPQRPIRGVGTKPLISFGANITLSGFIYSTSMGCDSLIIGRVFGPVSVGLYTRAATLISRPLQQMINPIYTVAVPTLSRLQVQPERYRKFYLGVFEALAIAAFLFVGLVLPLAHPLTVSILGDRWEAAAVIFAGFSVSAIYIPLSSAASWLYTSQGRGADILKLSIIEAILTISSVFIGLRYGPSGVAVALSISGVFVKLPLTFQIAGRSGPVRSQDLWTALLTHFPVGVIAGGVTWGTYLAIPSLSPLKQLFVCIPCGLLASALTIFVYSPSRRVSLGVFDALRALKKR